MLQLLISLLTYVGKVSRLPATLFLNLWTWVITRLRYKRLFRTSAADAIAYTYKDLESVSHIRIVELLPKNTKSPKSPRCRIHHMDLNAPSFKYAGVSYAWGDTSVALRKPVHTTEGSVLLVSPNLHSCLCRLQQKAESVFLWADALCINQGDDEHALRERSAQILLMRRIFSEAEEVLVELGEFPADDDVLVNGFQKIESVNEDLFKEVLSCAEKDYYHSPDSPYILEKSFRQRQSYYDSFEALLSTLDLPNHKHPFWPAFERLLQRHWFHRIWIIQEMSMAKQLRFVLGKYGVTEAMFRTATQRAIDYRDVKANLCPNLGSRLAAVKANISFSFSVWLSLARYVWAGFKTVPLPADERWVFKNAVRYDLFGTRALAQFRAFNSEVWALSVKSRDIDYVNSLALYSLFSDYLHFHCSDPRDRVYALLGLANDGGAPELYVDYAESVHDLSVRLSKYLIANGMGNMVLYHSSYAASQLPSWAISLKDVKKGKGFLEGRMTSGRPKDQHIFRAAGSTTFEYHVTPNLDPHLMTRGTILASIVSLTVEAPIDGQESLESFMIHTFRWGIEASWWMHEKAAWLGLPEPDFRLKCFRVLLADLQYDDKGRMERAGDDASAVSFQKTLEFWFPPLMTLGERLKRTNSAQYLQEAGNVRISAQLLKSTLPGRCLGIALSTGNEQTPCKENPKTSANPQTTSTAWICQLPGKTKIGDQIAIINGCPIPFVLRKDPDSESFRIVGCCYVDREMDGEAMDSGKLPLRDIVLI